VIIFEASQHERTRMDTDGDDDIQPAECAAHSPRPAGDARGHPRLHYTGRKFPAPELPTRIREKFYHASDQRVVTLSATWAAAEAKL
jgi:hypothetical protein